MTLRIVLGAAAVALFLHADAHAQSSGGEMPVIVTGGIGFSTKGSCAQSCPVPAAQPSMVRPFSWTVKFGTTLTVVAGCSNSVITYLPVQGQLSTFSDLRLLHPAKFYIAHNSACALDATTLVRNPPGPIVNVELVYSGQLVQAAP